MILDQHQQTEATIMGDVKNNKVDIDRSNIDFITTLLSTNLYSNPIQSFLRETVANGWDSQVEAGTTDIALLVRIFKDRDDIKVSIRDFGTGLSPERFDQIYLNIGSSTKRNSNDYIGAMGIGRFSALACSDMVNIRSFYKGFCYSYLMYKDGASICIDKLSQTPSTSDNGVEVTVSIGKYVDRFNFQRDLIRGLKSLSYFEKLYLQNDIGDLFNDIDDTFVTDFNERQIHIFKSFKVISTRPGEQCRLLMGTVSYPIQSNMVTSILGVNPPIDLICNIGDVDVTPNREQLLYNSKTTHAIEASLKKVKEELINLLKTKFTGDFDNIQQWFDFIGASYFPMELYKFSNVTRTVEIPASLYQSYGITNMMTIGGKKIPANLDTTYRAFLNLALPMNLVTYTYYREQFHVSHKYSYRIEHYIESCREHRIRLLSEPYKPITKKYVQTLLNDASSYSWSSIFFINPAHLKIEALKLMHAWNKYQPNRDEAKKFIIEDFRKNWIQKFPTINNSDVPQAFKDAEKTVSTSDKRVARKCVIYKLEPSKLYDYNAGHYHIVTNSNQYNSLTIGKFGGTVLYAEKDNDMLRDVYALMQYEIPKRTSGLLNLRYYLYVEVAPSNLKVLEEHKNCIHVNNLLVKSNATLKKLATAKYLYEKYGDFNSKYYCGNKEFLDNIGLLNLNRELDMMADLACTLSDIQSSHLREFANSLCDLYITKGWLDYRLIAEVEEHPEILQFRKASYYYQYNEADLFKLLGAVILTHNNKSMAKKQIFDIVKKTLHSTIQHNNEHS